MKWNSEQEAHANLVFTYCLVVFLLSLLFSGCGKDSPGKTPQVLEYAALSFSDAPMFDFGFQIIDSVTDHTFTITNSGKKTATEMTGSFYLSVSYFYKDGVFPGTGGTCTDTLSPQASCTAVVSFKPKEHGQTQTTMTISFNDGSGAAVAHGPVITGAGN